MFVLKIQFKKEHFFFAVRTLQGVIAHSGQKTIAPGVETEDDPVLGFMDSFVKIFIHFTMSGIKPIVTGHLEILFRDMLDEQADKVDGRKSPSDEGVIFMLIIMEGHIFTVIGINPGEGDDRASKITADIMNNRFRIAEIRSGINIEAIFIFTVDFRLGLFEGGPDTLLQFI